MSQKKCRVVAIGEVLWDCFDDEKKLGGAPFNFTYYVQDLGEKAFIITRVGNDEPGREILSLMEELRMNSQFVQIDQSYPTGKVLVEVNKKGEPTFNILPQVAYDYIAEERKLFALVRSADVLYFGTLAQRNQVSRHIIHNLLDSATSAKKVYDINLRQNYYSQKIIKESLKKTDVLKLNREELDILKRIFHLEKMSDEAVGLKLIQKYQLEIICITLGEKGCLLLSNKGKFSSPGIKVKVIDSVGSGDAFAAALVIGYLHGKSYQQITKSANATGAYITTKKGAITPISWKQIEKFERRGLKSD